MDGVETKCEGKRVGEHRECVEEVVQRYDVDADGRLNPEEVAAFMLGFWGENYGPGMVQVMRSLYSEFEAEEAECVDYRWRGYSTLKGMTDFCIAEAAKDKFRREKVLVGLREHGYDTTDVENLCLGKDAVVSPISIQDVAIRYAKYSLMPEDVVAGNWRFLDSLLMDVTNVLIGLKQMPNEELLGLLTRIRDTAPEEWANRKDRWRIEEQTGTIRLLRESGQYESAEDMSDAFREFCDALFDTWVEEEDGALTMDNFSLVHIQLCGELPRPFEWEAFGLEVPDYCNTCRFGAGALFRPSGNTMASEPKGKATAISRAQFYDMLGEKTLRDAKGFKLNLIRAGYDGHLRVDKSLNSASKMVEALYGDAVDRKWNGISTIVTAMVDIINVAATAGLPLSPRHIDHALEVFGDDSLRGIFGYRNYTPLTDAADAFYAFCLSLKLVKSDFSGIILDALVRRILVFMEAHPAELEAYLLGEDAQTRLCTEQTLRDMIDRRTCNIMGGSPSVIGSTMIGCAWAPNNGSEPDDGYEGGYDDAVAHEGDAKDKLLEPSAILQQFAPQEAIVIYSTLQRALPSHGFGNSPAMVVQLTLRAGLESLQILVDEGLYTASQFGFIRSTLEKGPLPDVLPPGVHSWSAARIKKHLAAYVGLKPDKVNRFLAAHGFLRHSPTSELPQDIGEEIHRDASALHTAGIDRHALAQKCSGLLAYGKFTSSFQMWGPFSTQEERERALQRLEPLRRQAIEGCGVDPLKDDECAFAVGYCATMGHHQNPFHPNYDSYYFKWDTVGGSADCVIVNKRLASRSYSSKELQQMLSDRLNAPEKMAWEDDDGVVYLSDMAPYLIRAACCFEGEETRYRVDPLKLATTLDIVKSDV